ncbi:hypothetical protein OSB04_008549 [Centaurea solstitialis]|uniref:Uncharacterized protein n=1 Tax=Centaurea solstitialis TaxID=347529 RepID=A0AA38WT80_9ASTR|nr:hypothetical protein OSB04_008549 [Centaurea solstitialis]
MKINKACDLSSISVLPPQLRRRSGISNSLPETSSTFRRSQAPSQQQQRSQQSLSQGLSSQHHAIFSQFSQNSQDETLTNDQLVVSQERESSLKRFSSLPPVNHTRGESQLPLSRSSTGLIRKWGSAISEQRCKFSELYNLAMDSKHSQAPSQQQQRSQQSFSQGLSSQHHASLHGDLKLISDQLNQDTCSKNTQDVSILLSSLQEKIGLFISNLRNDLSKSFAYEMQAIVCKLKELDQKNPPPTVLPPQAVSYCANPMGKAPKIAVVPPKVKREQVTLTNRDYSKGHKHNRVSQTGLAQPSTITAAAAITAIIFQGLSSQHHAIFSQFSQNSQDETLTNDQVYLKAFLDRIFIFLKYGLTYFHMFSHMKCFLCCICILPYLAQTQAVSYCANSMGKAPKMYAPLFSE